MNYFKKIFPVLLLMMFAITATSQTIPARPNPPRLVNDFTHTLTEDQRQALENKLVAFNDSTSTQIAVVIVANTDGDDISSYNVKLGRSWGVGGKEFSNGVVLLIAKDDHKLNIATGYGVEGALPDITCKHIIDEEIVPNFKGNDYYRGIDEGTDAIMKAVKGEYTASPKKYSGSRGLPIGRIIFIIIIIIFFLARSGGGGKGGFMSRRGATGLAGPLFWGSFLGSGGGSGWGGGGGGSSGGFGGFGGGSFGGGGASGSW